MSTVKVMMHQVQYWLCDLVELGGWPGHQKQTLGMRLDSGLADLYYMDCQQTYYRSPTLTGFFIYILLYKLIGPHSPQALK